MPTKSASSAGQPNLSAADCLADAVQRFRNLPMLGKLLRLRATPEYRDLCSAWDNYALGLDQDQGPVKVAVPGDLPAQPAKQVSQLVPTPRIPAVKHMDLADADLVAIVDQQYAGGRICLVATHKDGSQVPSDIYRCLSRALQAGQRAFSVSVATMTESHRTTYLVRLVNNAIRPADTAIWDELGCISPFMSENKEHAMAEAKVWAEFLGVSFEVPPSREDSQ